MLSSLRRTAVNTDDLFFIDIREVLSFPLYLQTCGIRKTELA